MRLIQLNDFVFNADRLMYYRIIADRPWHPGPSGEAVPGPPTGRTLVHLHFDFQAPDNPTMLDADTSEAFLAFVQKGNIVGTVVPYTPPAV